MANTKKAKSNKSMKATATKTNLTELFESRDGGQIALRGYSYQFLYSCHLILSSTNNDTTFSLEGIEDIDTIKYCNNEKSITHIQLKYSTLKQDASFMNSVFKNFLEAYLIDLNRCFKLIYDFNVASGNLSKLFFGKLDESSRKFWKEKIDNIKKETPTWNWSNFDFNDFISKLFFENVKKDCLEKNIKDSLIQNFDITTDNIDLYANSIKLLCFDKMVSRDEIAYNDVVRCIEMVRFDISKGIQNPAHSWIQRLCFLKAEGYSSDYYEGKKATPSDIANSLPVERPIVEKEIIDSIHNNTITIIKTSSGQGKTTLALRAILALQEEYAPYQITWCNNISELGHIVEYFRMRTRLGEKPLILLDNLDAHLSEWNKLVQLMQTSVTYHYKIVVTSRENDWYNFSGDISNLHSLQTIKPLLTEKEAESIFYSLQKEGKLHHEIIDWKNPWSKIADRKLLIEYVYLLTHGEMIAERISAQMKEIGTTSEGKIKFEILRKVCFADICGIKLETRILIKDVSSTINFDIGEILKSLTDEFLVHISTNGDYIEGLHPVRSKHIVTRLHEYTPLNETALSIAKIASVSDLSMLFSHYPEFDFDKKEFYSDIVTMWLDLSDLSRFVKAIRGTFSGSIMQYFRNNKTFFDDAYEHAGLPLIAADLCPFAKFEEYDQELATLDKMAELLPENTNIKYLIELRDSIPRFNIEKTDIYFLNFALYEKLKDINFTNIIDIESYATITDWLYNMDSSMNLSLYIDLKELWNHAEKYSIKSVSSLMFTSFCGNKDAYNKFVKNNLPCIISYLKRKTASHVINISDNNKCIEVGYILRANKITKGNNESVSRLTEICRTLPIFDKYCSYAIKPKIDLLQCYQIPDDAHKEMPVRNLIIIFHQEFNSLWLNTIQSNYEFDTIYAWIDHWLKVRKSVCEMLEASCSCMYKLLEGKRPSSAATSFDDLHIHYKRMTTAPLSYPREYRPFKKKPELSKRFNKVKSAYFISIQNFSDQFVNFIKHEDRFEHLAVYNLNSAIAALPDMQKFFDNIDLESEHRTKHKELCAIEEKIILETYMCCEYYISHKPDLRFNKFQVKSWFLSSQKADIDNLSALMSNLKYSYNAEFPIHAYKENTFLCYPILLNNFDVTDETAMDDFLINALTFAESPFDYLILLITNKDGKVIPNAIKFPKRTFQYLYKEIVLKEHEDTNDLVSPYPTEVNLEMLECFDTDFVLQDRNIKIPWTGHVCDIGEALWAYSKNRELLVEETDAQYLTDNLSAIKKEIEEIIEDIKLTADTEIISSINKLCADVCNGESFDDNKYNKLIDAIQSLCVNI